MSDENSASIHYVCTYDESINLLAAQREFYLRTCGCRARNPQRHADNNCCLWFTSDYSDEHGYAEGITAAAAAALLEGARETGLIIRPFRDFQNRNTVIGICFCCACCCSYFQDHVQEACDKGASIEHTAQSRCNDCGRCLSACLFNARTLADGVLHVDREKCYGCGICTDICPTGAIGMVGRSL